MAVELKTLYDDQGSPVGIGVDDDMASLTEEDLQAAVGWLDMADLDGDFVPDRWLVEGLLEEEDLVSLAGMWGAGKSYVAQALAIAVADDGTEEFLGFPVVTHGRVLYFDAESRKDKAKNRLKELGGDSRLVGKLFYSLSSFSFQDHDDARLLLKVVKNYEPKLVVFDSFVRFLGADENDAREIAKVYSAVLKPLRDAGASVVLLDHVPKSRPDGGWDPNTAARGSGDKAAAADRLWVLDIPDPSKTTQFRLRFGRAKEHAQQTDLMVVRNHQQDPRRVWFSAAQASGRRDHPGDYWVDRIVAELTKAGGELTQVELTHRVFGSDRRKASEYVKRAVQLGLVTSAAIAEKDGRRAKGKVIRLSDAA
jgi:hypothetical protein